MSVQLRMISIGQKRRCFRDVIIVCPAYNTIQGTDPCKALDDSVAIKKNFFKSLDPVLPWPQLIGLIKVCTMMSWANLVLALMNWNQEAQRIIASWMLVLQLKDPASRVRAGGTVMAKRS